MFLSVSNHLVVMILCLSAVAKALTWQHTHILSTHIITELTGSTCIHPQAPVSTTSYLSLAIKLTHFCHLALAFLIVHTHSQEQCFQLICGPVRSIPLCPAKQKQLWTNSQMKDTLLALCKSTQGYRRLEKNTKPSAPLHYRRVSASAAPALPYCWRVPWRTRAQRRPGARVL